MSPINKSRTGGSIMIAALIITLITGSLVGLFLKTITQEVQNSYRFRMGFQAVNLAEAGLDFAIDAMIKDAWSSSQWTAGSDGYLGQNFPYVSYSWKGEQRSVWVYIEPERAITIDGEDVVIPAAVAEGIIRLPSGVEVRRQIYVEMARGNRGNGFWGNGILGKRGVTLGGTKQTIDSFTTYPYDPTDPDNADDVDDRTRYAAMDVESIYGEQQSWTRLGHYLAYPNGSIASLSVKLLDISVQNADVYGKISTGASEEGADLKKFIGPQGSLYDNNEVMEGSTKDAVDLGNIAYDFEAELPDVDPPAMASPSTEISGATLGTSGAEADYELASLNVGSTDTLTVEGDVTLVIKGDMDVGGTLQLAEGASLRIFVKGDVTIGGTGLVNTGSPRNLIIYNTTSAEDIADGDPRPIIKLHGNGFLSAAVYAPEAEVSLRGGGGSGEMFGAVVGDTVTFSGNNYNFHYDESLAYLNDDGAGQSNPEVTNWVELTESGDRYQMTSILTDGLR